MCTATQVLFCLCLWKDMTGASPVSVRPQGSWESNGRSRKEAKILLLGMCKQQSRSGWVKDLSQSQSPAGRRHFLEYCLMGALGGFIIIFFKKKMITLGFSALSSLIKFKEPQVGNPQRWGWEETGLAHPTVVHAQLLPATPTGGGQWLLSPRP